MKNVIAYCLITLVTLFVCKADLHAQSGITAYFRKGEDHYKRKEYFEAAQYYEKYLSGNKKPNPAFTAFSIEKKMKGSRFVSNYQLALFHLAESYRLYNDFQNAEKWYRIIVKEASNIFPDCVYWYAVCLRANKHYEEAVIALTAYIDDAPNNNSFLMRAERELDNLRFIQKQENNNVSPMLKIGEPLQISEGYAIGRGPKDSLSVTANFKDSLGEQNDKLSTKYHSGVFTFDEREGPGKRNVLVKDDGFFDQGFASFSENGDWMFFTRWNYVGNDKKAAIYYRRKTDDKWSEALELNSPVNLEGWNSSQPYITSDSRYLFFVSDRPGGMGKNDIWYATLDSSLNPVLVTNLGEKINTAGDEASPFFYTPTRTLVFASNGNIGMGGFDVYYSVGNYSLKEWNMPVNPGRPLNSEKDDIYYYSTDKDNLWNLGWVSSDRASQCCLQLFPVRLNSRQLISGTVIDCKTKNPLKGVQLAVTESRNNVQLYSNIQTDSTGSYYLELRNVSAYSIRLTMDGYISSEEHYVISVIPGIDSIKNPVYCLRSLKDSVMDVVNGELNLLSKQGTVGTFHFMMSTLNASASSNLDSLYNILTRFPLIRLIVEGHTDSKGTVEYNLALSAKRVDACINYLVSKGISRERLIARPMGKCCPLVPETVNGQDIPAAREVNRRVEYKIISDDGIIPGR